MLHLKRSIWLAFISGEKGGPQDGRGNLHDLKHAYLHDLTDDVSFWDTGWGGQLSGRVASACGVARVCFWMTRGLLDEDVAVAFLPASDAPGGACEVDAAGGEALFSDLPPRLLDRLFFLLLRFNLFDRRRLFKALLRRGSDDSLA
ncbi:unnamed protein product [Soboliphyme baturini]|uniref:F-box domain-containing protein n=1 Tax=Soboliphyme baturini TaxID=241478 RepID=A0A183IR08_9BILA|nr:unnamed protein product [Soboliphyme baturini]